MQPAKSTISLPSGVAGSEISLRKLKPHCLPAMKLGPELRYRAIQPRYSKRNTIGPNMDWVGIQRLRQPNMHPQASVPIRAPPSPVEDEQLCFNNNRRDDDDSSQVR